MVRLIIKSESVAVVEEDAAFLTAKKMGRSSQFLLCNAIILLLLRCFEPLPRESAVQEIHQHVSWLCGALLNQISKYSEHKVSWSRNTLPDDRYLWELI